MGVYCIEILVPPSHSPPCLTLSDPCLTPVPRPPYGLWRPCGWPSPSCPSCGSTTPTASTSAGPVCPARRSCCWPAPPRRAAPRLHTCPPPSLSDRNQNYTFTALEMFRGITTNLRSALFFLWVSFISIFPQLKSLSQCWNRVAKDEFADSKQS